MIKNGTFVISLDFELYWGVRDQISLEDYKPNLEGVRKVVPSLIDLFKKYSVSSTFATVGFLFFNDKNELLNGLPIIKPTYEEQKLDPYPSLNSIGDNETSDIYHYAPSLIDQLIKGDHEIGTHTFSHFYCLEKGQTLEQFRNDIRSAMLIAKKRGIEIKSIIFPRHQFNEDHLRICWEEGISVYRGNQKSWVHKPLVGDEKAYLRRLIRIIDTYINILGHNTYKLDTTAGDKMVNIPASRFLRPYSKKISILDGLRLRRICSEMNYAAKNNRLYHLWWHPHNFGTNLQLNLNFLEQILIHYKKLNEKYTFECLTMKEAAHRLSTG